MQGERRRESQKQKKKINETKELDQAKSTIFAKKQETTGPRTEQEQQRKNQIRCEETRSNQRPEFPQFIEGLIVLLLCLWLAAFRVDSSFLLAEENPLVLLIFQFLRDHRDRRRHTLRNRSSSGSIDRLAIQIAIGRCFLTCTQGRRNMSYNNWIITVLRMIFIARSSPTSCRSWDNWRRRRCCWDSSGGSHRGHFLIGIGADERTDAIDSFFIDLVFSLGRQDDGQ